MRYPLDDGSESAGMPSGGLLFLGTGGGGTVPVLSSGFPQNHDPKRHEGREPKQNKHHIGRHGRHRFLQKRRTLPSPGFDREWGTLSTELAKDVALTGNSSPWTQWVHCVHYYPEATVNLELAFDRIGVRP